ncbi:MAG: hypothetical protein BWY25_03262 [Chloroflexi bacterium ADurb.Bin222]|jgi:hypothetical protein|nr:MAG: hypothetical protein BWY25_03262 [Chloroflexi bacterium ADurb.Bin222]
MTKPTVTTATLRRIEAWVAEWNQKTPREKAQATENALRNARAISEDASPELVLDSMLSTPKGVL